MGGTMRVLYLGMDHPLKGVKYLKQAALEINQTNERSATPDKPLIELRIASDAQGEAKEQLWRWCEVLCLPTLSENFGLVVAEALERGKRVVVTDGAPAWEPMGGGDAVDWGYDGRLVYLRGYRDGTETDRVELLKTGLEACRTAR